MELWLDEKEAARVTGFSRYWFQKKRVEGGGPPFQKIGFAVRYPAAELVEWMNSFGLVRNTSEQPGAPRRSSPERKGSTMILRRRTDDGRIRVMLLDGIETPRRRS